ncbi:MAG TPA: nucleotide disphospho-sugar-binding domain-containing protein [Solirubrobacterales bacterium]|nr:nucleotide disphospho-sugar-binding domain-containing protein [Solirubrobacterales bacterium]
MPVLAELRRRGHQIALRTLAAETETMRRLGFDAAPVAAEVEALEMDDWRAKSRLGVWPRGLRVLGARAPLEARDLERAIAANAPDVLIIDVLAWGALAAAEAWGGPWACSCPFPLPIPSRDGPPAGPGFRPARGPLGRLRDRVAETLTDVGFDRFAGGPVTGVRAGVGLPPLTHARDLYTRAPLHLYMTARPFEHRREDWPESIVMVGPCQWEPPGEMPPELLGVAEPLVLVTTSSEFQNDGKLVKTALEALADEPLHVVATMPAAAARDLEVPANATVLPFAPHTPVLRRAACAVTHGGMGATQKALSLGVPVCAVPFGRDQFEVARRVELVGAGRQLSPWRLRPTRLRAKVHEAIACRAGAERIGRAFAAAGGGAAAADAVERRLLD